jgi:hypothetical protein
MNWRIYRLPGSREVWHVDSGDGTVIYNVHGYVCMVPSRSIDIGGNNSPRAWIEIDSRFELHLMDGVARFSNPHQKLCTCTQRGCEKNMTQSNVGSA